MNVSRDDASKDEADESQQESLSTGRRRWDGDADVMLSDSRRRLAIR